MKFTPEYWLQIEKMLILHSRYRGIKGKIQGNNWEKMLISHSRYRGIKRYRGIILKNVAIVQWSKSRGNGNRVRFNTCLMV